ncbi:cilia- and flagella-associated protein 251-like [Acipenser ruthenus]|uniref:cilia- and flagella-associated protein 251-like n=1 Tax=Acipenser ruthenus TaxID=7906 RepID=UPI002742058C|nr:cilia- and flagella-associated protein 251-like [Acipenser ruthenus]
MHITDLKFVGDNREGEEEGGERARDREEEEKKIPELKEELLEQDIGVCKSEGSDMGLKFVADHREGEEGGGERARDREEEEEKKIPELKEELLEQDIGVCKSEGSDMGLACHLCGELRVKVEVQGWGSSKPLSSSSSCSNIGVCKSEGSDMGLKFVGDHREGEEGGGERARDREEEEEEKKIPELKEELLEQDIGVCKSEGSDMGLACHLCGELRVKVEVQGWGSSKPLSSSSSCSSSSSRRSASMVYMPSISSSVRALLLFSDSTRC